jgi:hypothetical protein
LKRLVLLAAALFGAASLAGARTGLGDAEPAVRSLTQAVSIPAAADVSIGTAGGNDGGSTTLTVAFDNSPPSSDLISIALLRFDLASALPANAVIDSAMMNVDLSVIGDKTSTLPVEVLAFLLASAWGEYAVTWSTQPMISEFPISASVDSTGRKTWDITAWAEYWLAHSALNYGVELLGPRSSEPDTAYYLYFSSRESDAKPYLDVTYHAPATATPTRTRTPTRTSTPKLPKRAFFPVIMRQFQPPAPRP